MVRCDLRSGRLDLAELGSKAPRAKKERRGEIDSKQGAAFSVAEWRRGTVPRCKRTGVNRGRVWETVCCRTERLTRDHK